MADGVPITPGSGVTVACEEVTTLNGATVSARQVQHVDLVAITADGVASSLAKGSGVAGNTVLRVVSASDDPAVALLTTQAGYLDGIESLIGTTNSTLTTQNGYLDGIESLIGTTNTNTGAATTALQIIDDWDESDRAKVNIIAGQAGVSAGTGNVDAGTLRVTLASDGQTATHINNALIGEYETVAASQTAQTLGATGATGDYLAGVLIIPATTSPGNVIILDNATSITIFTGGASSVSNLVPFLVPLGIKSVSGAWKITTGASVSAIGIGNFT